LAFKGKETAEIYDILMEQLLRAIKKYDPTYTDKVKLVAGVINDLFAERSSSQSLSLTTLWSLIAIAVCACLAAVAFSRRSSRKEERDASLGGRGQRPGLHPNPSSRTGRSGLHIIYRPGSDTTCKSTLPVKCLNLKPTKVLRPLPLLLAGMLAVRSVARFWNARHGEFIELIEVVCGCLGQLI
jgi:hypothetical protein